MRDFSEKFEKILSCWEEFIEETEEYTNAENRAFKEVKKYAQQS